MNAWYFISAPAWLILILTAGARLSDMGRNRWALQDHIRRLGMIGVAAWCAVALVAPIAEDWWVYGDATWRGALGAWSWALVWMTTPGMPPWYDFILGVHRNTELWTSMGMGARMRGEGKALRDSFRPSRFRVPKGQAVAPYPPLLTRALVAAIVLAVLVVVLLVVLL